MAGGIVSNWSGEEVRLEPNFKIFACANQELHHKVLKVINN
jgi:fructose-1,6-bisphosphatase/inositol monophosphatase family enzyme